MNVLSMLKKDLDSAYTVSYSLEECRELCYAWRLHQDYEARDKLVASVGPTLLLLSATYPEDLRADLLQAALLATLEAVDTWDEWRGMTFNSYVYSYVARKAMNRELKVLRGNGDLPIGDLVDMVAAEETPLTLDTALDLLATLDDRLADKQRRVIELRYQDGLTQVEVAEILGISQPAVLGLERRGIESLKKLLA